MGKKITVEFKDAEAYKDLVEISRLCKEPPEELLERAFKEWVLLREDLEDLDIIRERKASASDEDWIPLEDVMKELGLDKTPTP